jgi:uncharacterized protein (DUF1697 family)
VPTHVALLRGINVGGGGKVPMADLRKLVTSLGHSDVATYIQSGNVVFTPATDDNAAVARELEAAIWETFSVRSPVVVLSRAELAEVVASTPYPDEPNPRYVHGVFLQSEPGQDARVFLAQALERAAERGDSDEATLAGRTLYLHTPGGLGPSELAKQLLVKRRTNPFGSATARNWATVTKLLEMCTG